MSDNQIGSLQCHGRNDTNQTQVYDDYGQGVIEVIAGEWHSCAIKENNDKTIKQAKCWGLNDAGQLDIQEEFDHEQIGAIRAGNKYTCYIQLEKIICVGQFTINLEEININHKKIKKLELGYSHLCQVSETELKCDGLNEFNQLDTPDIDPSQVISESLVTKFNHTCLFIIEPFGKVHCWGSNEQGQLNVTMPVDWIGTGYNHTCSHKGQGYIHCYGSEQYGLSQVPKKITQYTHMISVGGNYTCLNQGGILKCFGKRKKELQTIPEELIQDNSIFTAGQNHMCACNTDNNKFLKPIILMCWGTKNSQVLTPPAITQTISSFINDMKSGFKFTCAVVHTETKSIVCWGINEQGQLDIPSFAGGTNDDHNEVRLGIAHACSRTYSNTLACWGTNEQNQTNIPPHFPHDEVIMVAAGQYHTCVIEAKLKGWCWGQNSFGQTDIPSRQQSNVILQEGGGYHTCGMSKEFKLQCWGSNRQNQLKLGKIKQEVVNYIALGENHTCLVESDGSVRCWGDDSNGQLGVQGKVKQNYG